MWGMNESAYITALSTVLDHHKDADLKDTRKGGGGDSIPQQLFDPEVQAIFTTCQDLLRDNYPAIYVLSRFLQRRAGWIRSRSFLKYFDSYFFRRYRTKGGGGGGGGVEDTVNGVVNEVEMGIPEAIELQKITSAAMQGLQQCGMVDILYEAGNSSFINVKESIAALGQTLTNEELKQLLKKMQISFPPSSGKADLMLLLTQCCLHTRTIYGNPISDRLPSLVKNILNSKINADNVATDFILRVCPRVGRALRRLQRLLQVGSQVPFHVYASTAAADGTAGLSNLPLMQGFGRVRFPQYQQIKSNPLFASKRRFEQWEASQDLYGALQSSGNNDIYSNESAFEELKEIIASLVQAFDWNASALGVHATLLVECMENDYLDRSFCIAIVGILAQIAYQEELDATASTVRTTASPRPEFFKSYDAGVVLARVANVLIAASEKGHSEGSSDPVLALQVLRLQLSSSFLTHKRGQWYTRMCVNYEHVHCYQQSLDVCEQALSDKNITMSDRISLERRLKSLEARKRQKQDNMNVFKSVVVEVPDVSCAALLSTVKSVLQVVVPIVPEPKLAATASHTVLSSPQKGKVFVIDLSGVVDLSDDADDAAPWACPICTYNNLSHANQCDMCGENNAKAVVLPPAAAAGKAISSSSANSKISSVYESGEKKGVTITVSTQAATSSAASSSSALAKRGTGIAASSKSKSNGRAAAVSNSSSSFTSTNPLKLECTSDDDGDGDGDGDGNADNVVTDLHAVDLAYLQMEAEDVHAQPRFLDLYGRRFGSTSKKGKNSFVGLHDELVNVEELVLEHCQQPDCEDSDAFCRGVDGGGWQGWHCEGSLLRTLFGLLFWDVIFAPIPDVFQSPFQMSPLDMCYSGFMSSRYDQYILPRLEELATMSAVDLIKDLGQVYRRHFRTKCLCVTWQCPLDTLQLVAICFGGANLASICRTFCTSYRHFRSGLPDLLLVRIRKVTSSSTKNGMQDDEDREFEAAEGKLNRTVPDTIDLSDLIGPAWLDLGWKSQGVDSEELHATAFSSGSPNPSVGTYAKVEDKGEGAIISRKRDWSGNDITETTTVISPVIVTAVEDDMTIADTGAGATAGASPTGGPLEGAYIYDGPDLSLPPNHETCLSFESLLVEVKGPNDHLSEKQCVWLSVFAKHGVNALVCRVTEKQAKPD